MQVNLLCISGCTVSEKAGLIKSSNRRFQGILGKVYTLQQLGLQYFHQVCQVIHINQVCMVAQEEASGTACLL